MGIEAYDTDAFAFAGAAGDGTGMPLDRAVPVRCPSELPDAIDVRTAFVLMHVDGTSSIAEIASYAQLPVRITLACVAELVVRGLVDLVARETDRRDEPKDSGIHVRAEAVTAVA